MAHQNERPKSIYFVVYRLDYKPDGTKKERSELGGTVLEIDKIIMNPYRHIFDTFIEHYGHGNIICMIACVDNFDRRRVAALKSAALACYKL